MYSELLSLIYNNHEFTITTHVNPDGDAIGSEIAMYHFLNEQGKKANIINYSPTPANYRFLDRLDVIEKFEESRHADILNRSDVVIILDTNELNRLKTMSDYLKTCHARKVVIDHHLGLDNEMFDLCLVDTESPATAQILFRLFKFAGINISRNIAEALYTAIMTDTGSFRFDRTTSETHRIAAELLETGINPYEIYSEVYNKASIGKLYLLSRFLQNVKLHYDGKLACSMVTRDDFLKTNTDEYAVEGFSSHLMSLESVLMGIIIVETPGGTKLSFRSKGDIYSNELAAQFGGGGHKNAAGAFINNSSAKEIENLIVSEAKNYI
jgi:phosphoesterase RecJ-like protein